MKYKRYIPLITPILIWLLSQAYLAKAELFYSSLAVGVLLIVLSVRYIAYQTHDNWLLFVIAPILFFLSLASYVAIIISSFWIKVIFLVTIWYLFLYLKNLYYYFNSNDQEVVEKRVASLDNLVIAGGFLTLFATSAVWFGLPAFLSWPPLHTLPALALVMLLLFVQFSLFSPNQSRPLGSTAFLIVLLLTEIAWGLSLLPLNFNILALFMSINYYFGLTVLRLKWSGSLNRGSIQLPLILSATAMFFLFITSRWL